MWCDGWGRVTRRRLSESRSGPGSQMNDTDQPLLILRLLGEPRISCQDRSLSATLAGKEEALLIYLASHPGNRFSRDHLATLLWGETSQERARYNLRRALWHLREALGEVDVSPDRCLWTEDSWVWVATSAPYWLDTREFEDVIGKAFRYLETEFSPASPGVRRIRETIELYRGPFLAGFSLSQAPGFEEWVLVERERLFHLLLRAHSSLIQSFIAWGEREEAIVVCQRLLALDPIQEDTHRLLMRLYWDMGRRSQALRQYRRCREILIEELDGEPVAETQDLHARILENEMSPTSISSLTLTSRLTMPTPAPETVLRPRLFERLDRGLSVPLTLISAPPGYGKTTLVAQWVTHRMQQNEQQELLFAWYRLSEADDAPLTLVEGLTTCLTRRHPRLGQTLREIYSLPTLQGDPRHAAGLLIKALTSLKGVDLALVLDDAELLTSPVSQDVLGFLIAHLPEHVHLYVLTRMDPELPLARMRVRGKLVEIRRAELRMTAEETESFLEGASGPRLDRSEVEELSSLARGWAAPLWLAANARSRFAANLEDVWEALFAYLRQEVLSAQPVDIGDFLLRTAILNELAPPVCEAVLSGPEPQRRAGMWLAELRHRNLFVQRKERQGRDEDTVYAYHPLFLRFLRTELPYHFSAPEIEALHRRAGRAWKEQGNHDQWLFHTLRVGDATAPSPGPDAP